MPELRLYSNGLEIRSIIFLRYVIGSMFEVAVAWLCTYAKEREMKTERKIPV